MARGRFSKSELKVLLRFPSSDQVDCGYDGRDGDSVGVEENSEAARSRGHLRPSYQIALQPLR